MKLTPQYYEKLFLTKRTQITKRNGIDRSLNKNTKNETGQNIQENGWNDWEKNDRKWKDLAGTPRSRTERNDFNKVGTYPARPFTLQT